LAVDPWPAIRETASPIEAVVPPIAIGSLNPEAERTVPCIPARALATFSRSKAGAPIGRASAVFDGAAATLQATRPGVGQVSRSDLEDVARRPDRQRRPITR